MIRVLTCLVSGEKSSWLYVGTFSLCLHVALPWGVYVVGKAESPLVSLLIRLILSDQGPAYFFKSFIYLLACIGLLVVARSIFNCGI